MPVCKRQGRESSWEQGPGAPHHHGTPYGLAHFFNSDTVSAKIFRFSRVQD